MLQPLHLGKPKLLLIQGQEILPAETSLYIFPVSPSICQRAGGRDESSLQKLILVILILPKIEHEEVSGGHLFYQSRILAFTSFHSCQSLVYCCSFSQGFLPPHQCFHSLLPMCCQYQQPSCPVCILFL